MIKKLKNKKGFTILESIVAIFVLSLSISGVFTAVQQSLSQSIIAKDEVRAFYLAQEAIEIIRNKRDANQLADINNGPTDWLEGVVSASDCPFNGVCKVDATAIDKIQVCSGSCENLKQDSNFRYGYLSGNTTNINREIRIESVGVNEITVTAIITWTKGALPPFTFKVKTHLFNWI